MIIMLITIINTYSLKQLCSKKLRLLELNIANNLIFAHELYMNINQNLFSFTFQTQLLFNFFFEHSRIAFNKRLYRI